MEIFISLAKLYKAIANKQFIYLTISKILREFYVQNSANIYLKFKYINFEQRNLSTIIKILA